MLLVFIIITSTITAKIITSLSTINNVDIHKTKYDILHKYKTPTRKLLLTCQEVDSMVEFSELEVII